jgi:hypothetical protein
LEDGSGFEDSRFEGICSLVDHIVDARRSTTPAPNTAANLRGPWSVNAAD